MHILGIHNGTPGGNSEILLKAALLAAQKSSPSITVSTIHAPSVAIPYNKAALTGAQDITNGVETASRAEVTALQPSGHEPHTDDRTAIFNAVLDADAIILSTPVYSHQPRGTLKAMLDSICGPFSDPSFAARVKAGKERGDPKYKDMDYDARLLKPKCAAFIAVAGSAQGLHDQWTMALPTLHTMVYSIHAKVVDQIIIPGMIGPGSVLLGENKAISRAEVVGKNVASQIGKHFDVAQYLGEEEVGACPYCHLLKIEFQTGAAPNGVRCIVCGSEGELKPVGQNGALRPVWEKDSKVSSITMKGKEKHLDDIGDLVQTQMPQLGSIKEELTKWRKLAVPVVELPSHAAPKRQSRL